MKYIGLQAQQNSNNAKSLLLLVLFPVVTLALVFVFLFALVYLAQSQDTHYESAAVLAMTWTAFVQAIPFTLLVVAVWFAIAYFSHTFIISKATGSKPLERKNNLRVYNLVENLCMSKGMAMPKINVIADSSLNAFASGINPKTYTITLTTGIIDKLNDEELEGVIAHELSHIRNRDVRLLIISIVFVGIFSLVAQMAFNMLRYSNRGSNNNKNSNVAIMIVAIVVALVGYFITTMMKFAISRKREYLADAGAAEMTKNPLALASALRKISKDPRIEGVSQDDVAQLFIEHPLTKKSALTSLFATHPPIEKRIAILEQL